MTQADGEVRRSAVEGRDRAAGQMDPTQIAEAQRLAREWDAAPPREPLYVVKSIRTIESVS